MICRIGIIAIAWVCVGCGAAPTRAVGVSVRRARLTTPGAVLTAEDGSFVARSGETFVPPPGAPLDSTPCATQGGPDAEDFAVALGAGAHRVRVELPDHSALQGVLLVCTIHPRDRSPISRSFQIEVPEDRVLETDGGRVSVVYELAESIDGVTRIGWALWLSEQF